MQNNRKRIKPSHAIVLTAAALLLLVPQASAQNDSAVAFRDDTTFELNVAAGAQVQVVHCSEVNAGQTLAGLNVGLHAKAKVVVALIIDGERHENPHASCPAGEAAGSEGSEDGAEGGESGPEGSESGSEGGKSGPEGSESGAEGGSGGSEGNESGSEGGAEAGACTGPRGLAAEAHDTHVGLSWEAPAGAEGYRVYRADGSGEAELVATVEDGTTFTDDDVQAGSTYTYFVTALTADGETEACSMMESTAMPVFPSVLAAVAGTVGAAGAYAVGRRRV